MHVEILSIMSFIGRLTSGKSPLFPKSTISHSQLPFSNHH